MNYKDVRYSLKVVDLIMKNDVVFDVLIKKETNRFIPHNDYYVTTFFDSSFVVPMAFFNGPNWVVVGNKISSKYGISDETTLLFIKHKLESLFREHQNKWDIY